MKEALKLALEALKTIDEAMPFPVAKLAQAAIKEALAQPEQEPVDFATLLREAEEIVQSKPTWKRFIDGTQLSNDIAVWMAVFAQDVARRTSPPKRPWVGLTDEERDECDWGQGERDYARAIEAKLKDKNT